MLHTTDINSGDLLKTVVDISCTSLDDEKYFNVCKDEIVLILTKPVFNPDAGNFIYPYACKIMVSSSGLMCSLNLKDIDPDLIKISACNDHNNNPNLEQ